MAKAKKDSFTPEEEALIPVFFDKYIKQQTEQASVEDITEAVNTIWADMGQKPPQIEIMDSPIACKKACPNLKEFASPYWSIWFNSYSAMYDFANTIGLEMDQEKLRKFLLWTRCCPFVLFKDDFVYVSRKPISLKFNDAGQLSCEDGPACEYADGWKIWSINGVAVTEQIVMHPETITGKQIKQEENAEVKRIMIERYGFESYFADVDAKLIHRRTNHIEGTKELLYQAEDMKFLLCICPSTGKEFALEVKEDIKTCEEAQDYLSGGLSSRIISAS